MAVVAPTLSLAVSLPVVSPQFVRLLIAAEQARNSSLKGFVCAFPMWAAFPVVPSCLPYSSVSRCNSQTTVLAS